MSETIKLDGASLPAVQKFDQLVSEFKQDVIDLQEEAVKKHEALRTRYLAELKIVWVKMLVPLGIDPEKAWNAGEWYVDTTYWQAHGDAFLCRRDAQGPTPMALDAFIPDGRPN